MHKPVYKRISIVLLHCILIFLFSCEKEIDFENNFSEQKLVINSLFSSDTTLTVQVSHTSPILSIENNLINNATVSLFENEIFMEDLQSTGNGEYVSSFNPVFNRKYKIVTTMEGYGTASGWDSVPQIVSINESKLEIGKTFDEYGDPHNDFTVGFTDPPNIENYYEMILFQQQLINNKVEDIHIFLDVEIADPVIYSEGYVEFNPLTFVFSDELFNGKYYELKMKMISGVVSGQFNNRFVKSGDGTYIILRSVTRTYYKYRKAWIKHKYNQQTGNKIEEPLFMVLIGDPVPMFSNIQNGYGVIAGYSQDYKKCEVIYYSK